MESGYLAMSDLRGMTGARGIGLTVVLCFDVEENGKGWWTKNGTGISGRGEGEYVEEVRPRRPSVLSIVG